MQPAQIQGVIDVKLNTRPMITEHYMGPSETRERAYLSGRRFGSGIASGTVRTGSVMESIRRLGDAVDTTADALEELRKTVARIEMRMYERSAESARALAMRRCAGNRRRQMRKQNRRAN